MEIFVYDFGGPSSHCSMKTIPLTLMEGGREDAMKIYSGLSDKYSNSTTSVQDIGKHFSFPACISLPNLLN